MPLASQEPELTQGFPWFAKPPAPKADTVEILVTSEWLEAGIAADRVTPIDVRPFPEFSAGHLPGAIRVPASRFENSHRPTDLPALDHTLVIYGSDQDREAIGQIFWGLSTLGFKDVRVLPSTFDQWRESGRTIATESEDSSVAPRAAAVAVPRDVVTREEVLAAFGRPGFEILDLRDPVGWGPLRQAPSKFSAGHIPNSLPFDPSTLLPQQGWPTADTRQAFLENVSIRPADPIDLGATFIVYGDNPSDPRIGLGYLVLRLLGLEVKVYLEGFEGWGREARSPVVQIVTAAELEERLSRGATKGTQKDGFSIFDLREAWDYADGHIPGAISLPDRLFAERFEGILRANGHSDTDQMFLVFYCYGQDCVRSRRCSTLAARKGFRRLLWFREGMLGWQEISGPIVKPTAKR